MKKNRELSEIKHYASTALKSLDNKSLGEVRGMLEGILIKADEATEINAEFDFWVDATTFLKTIVVENAEQLFIDHVKERGFNDNEMHFFRAYLKEAFDMTAIMAYLKMKCDE